MKISAQEKIAELERRIVALEDREKKRIRTAKTGTVTATATKNGQTIEVERPLIDEIFGTFDDVFKRIFG